MFNPAEPKLHELLIDTKAAAKLLGQSAAFLEQDRVTKRHGVPYVKIGSSVRYRPSELVAWIERHAVRVEREAA